MDDICDNVKDGAMPYVIGVPAFVAVKACITVYDFCYVLRYENVGVCSITHRLENCRCW